MLVSVGDMARMTSVTWSVANERIWGTMHQTALKIRRMMDVPMGSRQISSRRDNIPKDVAKGKKLQDTE